jgi:hypothetical protein
MKYSALSDPENEAVLREIESYFSSLQTCLDLVRPALRELDQYVAGGFNVFDYIRPDENELSDILADFLDRNGCHGQGDIFLRSFLTVVRLDHLQSCGHVKIVREDPTMYISRSSRKIDITADFDSGSFGIGIENKPWAGEQEDQVKEYSQHLERKYRDNYRLVYLSGNGNEPQSIGDQERENLKKSGHLIIFPYWEIKSWLDTCYRDCRAEKVRWFLKDFSEYISREFAPTTSKEELSGKPQRD